MDNTETTEIIIGGVKRKIISYRRLAFLDYAKKGIEAPIITPLQYNSIIFNNLGYNKCPENFDWIRNGISVEDAPKTNVIDYAITAIPLYITEGTNLLTMFCIFNNLIKDDLERGHLVDSSRSFKFPPSQEIKFNMQNNISIKRQYSVRARVEYWNKADIIRRRLYNVSPLLDKEYYDLCLSRFKSTCQQIIPENPFIVFTSFLIDPDILMSTIRKAEKEAAKSVMAYQKLSRYMIEENEVEKMFIYIMQEKFKHLYRIYNNKGAKGFVRNKTTTKIQILNHPSLSDNFKLYDPYVTQVQYNQAQSQQDVINIILAEINRTPLDGEHKSTIFNYVEQNSLKILDNMGEESEERIFAYKKLFYTINQIKINNPELLNKSDKLIFSNTFYVDAHRFALYSRSRNIFYVASSDLSIREMTPAEAIEFYNIYLGKTVELDPNEMYESLDSPLVEDIDLDKMLADSEPITNITQVYQQPIIQIQQPVEPPKIIDPDARVFGFDPNIMVQNYANS